MTDPEPEEGDPLMAAIVDALMKHAAPLGSVDFPVAAGAFARIIAEMIHPQPSFSIRRAMRDEFNRMLDAEIVMMGLRVRDR